MMDGCMHASCMSKYLYSRKQASLDEWDGDEMR